MAEIRVTARIIEWQDALEARITFTRTPPRTPLGMTRPVKIHYRPFVSLMERRADG